MEKVKFYSSNDQKVIHCKSQIAKTSKKKDMNYQPFISRPVENFYQPPLLQTGSFLQQHRPRDHFNSYPPFLSPKVHQQQQQPPLLPLPLPHTRIQNSDSHPRIRSFSCQPTTNRRYRNDSPTPKKSKPLQMMKLKPTTKDVSDQVITKIHKPLIAESSEIKLMKDVDVDVDDFSGSAAFTLSPPPSSLPLPTFSLRRKLNSCNVEAAGFDAGATDNLQRLLRLRLI